MKKRLKGFLIWYKLLRKKGKYGILISFHSSLYNSKHWPNGENSEFVGEYVTSSSWGEATTAME